MSDLSDLDVDDQFLLGSTLFGPMSDFPGTPEGDGFEFFPAPEKRTNDQPDTVGSRAGWDSPGARLLTFDGVFFVERETAVMDRTVEIGAAFAQNNILQPLTFQHQGEHWTYFVRTNGVKVKPGTGFWTWEAEVRATDPYWYGDELGPLPMTKDVTLIVDPGGIVYSPRWSVVIVAGASAVTAPIVGYTTRIGNADVLLTLSYPTIPAGSTLIVSGRYGDDALAVVDNGMFVTSVDGFEVVSGRPARLIPTTSAERSFSVTWTSGPTAAAHALLMDAYL